MRDNPSEFDPIVRVVSFALAHLVATFLRSWMSVFQRVLKNRLVWLCFASRFVVLQGLYFAGVTADM